jgi:hypothetical protein
MTYFYYKSNSWSDAKVSLKTNDQIPEETKKVWELYAKKKNWRIVQLPNGYYQTEWQDDTKSWNAITRRETIDGAEKAIDSSIEHYKKKLKLSEGPIVVKTFK